jgi:hypothetical protein
MIRYRLTTSDGPVEVFIEATAIEQVLDLRFRGDARAVAQVQRSIEMSSGMFGHLLGKAASAGDLACAMGPRRSCGLRVASCWSDSKADFTGDPGRRAVRGRRVRAALPRSGADHPRGAGQRDRAPARSASAQGVVRAGGVAAERDRSGVHRRR